MLMREFLDPRRELFRAAGRAKFHELLPLRKRGRPVIGTLELVRADRRARS